MDPEDAVIRGKAFEENGYDMEEEPEDNDGDDKERGVYPEPTLISELAEARKRLRECSLIVAMHPDQVKLDFSAPPSPLLIFSNN